MHPTDERLEAFSDGTLAKRDRTVVAAHIVQCGRCRSEVEDWRSMFTMLSAMPMFAPPAPAMIRDAKRTVRLRVKAKRR